MLNIDKTKALFPLINNKIEIDIFTEDNICDEYILWLNDPEVVKYSNQRFKRHSKESCQHYLSSFSDSHALFLTIRDQTSKNMYGTMTAYFNPHHQTCDIGIMVGNKNVWGQGIGYKAWLLLLITLLEVVQVRKVTAGTLSCNSGMIRIMEKAGMKPDGVRVAQELIDGKPYDIIHFSAFEL